MAGRLAMFLWKHQLSLAFLYLVLLGGAVWGVYWYAYRVPPAADAGLAVMARSVAYQRTFDQVEAACREIGQGNLANAETRLRVFIYDHQHVQTNQLETHALTDAHEALADIYLRQGKFQKAANVLDDMAERTPLNYRLWYLKGNACKAAGDTNEAVKAFRRAFKLALNHTEITESYLGALSELNAYADILWVADHFQRAARRGAPSVLVELGVARTKLHRRLLRLAEVPVKHGTYFRRTTLERLPRGSHRKITIGHEFLDPWPFAPKPLYVQLRFNNVYDGLQIEAFHYTTRDGERHVFPLNQSRLSYLHRPHSGAEYYAEIRTDLDVRELRQIEVVYSCPEAGLSDDALAIVDKARTNLKARMAGL